jgi:predicted DNA-binding protein (UPF0251 family)
MSDSNRFKTRTELAEELGISRRTLYSLLKEAGVDIPKGLLSPKTQQLIIEVLEKHRLQDHEDEEE